MCVPDKQGARIAAIHDKPFSPACERNRDPILAVLRRHFAQRSEVLEIGSGSGQHAAHFAAALPALRWQASDRAQHLPGIRAWLDEAALPNTPPPLALDVAEGAWPARRYDAAFSANTLHILAWPQVERMFAGLDRVLRADATLAIYGPFNHGGAYTGAGNRDFDGWLKARDPDSAIRGFEAVDALARGIGLRLAEDAAMPADNRCLVWTRVPDRSRAAAGA